MLYYNQREGETAPGQRRGETDQIITKWKQKNFLKKVKKSLDKSPGLWYYNTRRKKKGEQKKMTTKFVYQVAGFEWVDTEAWGTAWKEAKAKATELHAAIYRLYIKGERVSQEVYYKGGCFNTVRFATPDNVKIF